VGCGRVETGSDRSLDARRFSVFIVRVRVGVVNPPMTALLPVSWGAKPYGCSWGVPEGILMNVAHLWTGCCKLRSLFVQPSEVQVRTHSKALRRKSNREYAFGATRCQKPTQGRASSGWHAKDAYFLGPPLFRSRYDIICPIRRVGVCSPCCPRVLWENPKERCV
jgi:hypothetical protein